MNAPRIASLLSILALAAPAELPAQDQGNGPEGDGRGRRRLSLVLDLGGSLGGPAAGLAEQLRRAGFDDTSPRLCLLGLCAGPTAHPTEEGPGGIVGLTARFALSGAVAVGAGYGNASLGGSSGYRTAPGSTFGDYVFSHWDATVVWAAAFWRPRPALRIGGGPGLYQLENVPEGFKVSQIGLMVEAGAEVPAHRRFFLNLAIRAHLVPGKDIQHGRAEPITLRPDWTHGVLLAGLGIHL